MIVRIAAAEELHAQDEIGVASQLSILEYLPRGQSFPYPKMCYFRADLLVHTTFKLTSSKYHLAFEGLECPYRIVQEPIM
jgi:hypothetical protein